MSETPGIGIGRRRRSETWIAILLVLALLGYDGRGAAPGAALPATGCDDALTVARRQRHVYV